MIIDLLDEQIDEIILAIVDIIYDIRMCKENLGLEP